ncbi:MAG: hypothetical protein HC836_46855 [Richelia sp. RM2_1_2]|nr:hypothetical protein [Richelia sp. RM2_1_2]
MVKWNKFAKNLPSKIQVSSNTKYEVLTIKEFKESDTMGETRFEARQIVLKQGLPAKDQVETFFHELLHAFSDEYGINLTERQIINMEYMLPYLIKFVKIIDK